MNHQTAYQDFTARFKLLISKNPHLITTTLSNIFTMRLIGNKTHGDLAEIAIAEFINQYMYDFKSIHTGKDLYRAKQHEEDIKVINEITKVEFPISLKAYGDGPLQLSTDKNFLMFPKLKSMGMLIDKKERIAKLWRDPVFAEFSNINVFPLIYDEKKQRCNILIFNYELAKERIARIVVEEEGKGRKHPFFRFYDYEGDYVCEVRYGSGTANAFMPAFTVPMFSNRPDISHMIHWLMPKKRSTSAAATAIAPGVMALCSQSQMPRPNTVASSTTLRQ